MSGQKTTLEINATALERAIESFAKHLPAAHISCHILHILEMRQTRDSSEDFLNLLSDLINTLQNLMLDSLVISGQLESHGVHRPFDDRLEKILQEEVEKTPPEVYSHKQNTNKIQGSILEDFGLALLEVAKAGTDGNKKYDFGSWVQVPDGIREYSNAMWRHLLAMRTEEIDPFSGLPHRAHFIWNALAVQELIKRAEIKTQKVEKL